MEPTEQKNGVSQPIEPQLTKMPQFGDLIARRKDGRRLAAHAFKKGNPGGLGRGNKGPRKHWSSLEYWFGLIQENVGLLTPRQKVDVGFRGAELLAPRWKGNATAEESVESARRLFEALRADSEVGSSSEIKVSGAPPVEGVSVVTAAPNSPPIGDEISKNGNPGLSPKESIPPLERNPSNAADATSGLADRSTNLPSSQFTAGSPGSLAGEQGSQVLPGSDTPVR